jgi:hypothetical protein
MTCHVRFYQLCRSSQTHTPVGQISWLPGRILPRAPHGARCDWINLCGPPQYQRTINPQPWSLGSDRVVLLEGILQWWLTVSSKVLRVQKVVVDSSCQVYLELAILPTGSDNYDRDSVWVLRTKEKDVFNRVHIPTL